MRGRFAPSCWRAPQSGRQAAELLGVGASLLDSHDSGGVADMPRLSLSEQVPIGKIGAHRAQASEADRNPGAVRVLPMIELSVPRKWHNKQGLSVFSMF
jgi:hypothetical protein